MPRRIFKTVSIDLIEYAEETASHFQNRGYKVSVERFERGFPYTPTLICKRQRTTMIIEVFEQISFDRLLAWVSYARSTNKDTRIAACLSNKVTVTTEQERILRDQGVGLYIATGNGVIERISPSDLALRIALPPLESLPHKLRTLLGSAYDQFGANWREGFEDACQAFETEARRYMKAGIQSGRITLVTNSGNTRTLTNQQVDKLTMGQLAVAFSQILNQNRADVVIGQALSTVNPDRVGVAHHKAKVKTERSLRTNLGQNMWTIVLAMKELMKP